MASFKIFSNDPSKQSFQFLCSILEIDPFPRENQLVQRETKREGIAAFYPIKYATIISVRGQARSTIALFMMLRVLFRHGSRKW